MSCNHCPSTSAAAAAQCGAPDVEAAWAGERGRARQCPDCGAFRRADGSCSRCENRGITVSSDGDTSLPPLPAATRHYLNGPIITHGNFGGNIPGWLRETVPQARLEQVKSELAAGEQGERATLTEASAYLYGASLEMPLSRDWAEIYQYVAVQAMQTRSYPGQDVWRMLGRDPIEKLSDDQQRELDHLLRWLRRQTIAAAKKK